MLICKFASHRSRPEKVRSYLAYLGQQLEQHGEEGEHALMFRTLIAQASEWLQQAPSAGNLESRSGSDVAESGGASALNFG